MDRYVARFADRRADWAAFEDAKIEGFKRAQHRFIGAGGSGKHKTTLPPSQQRTLLCRSCMWNRVRGTRLTRTRSKRCFSCYKDFWMYSSRTREETASPSGSDLGDVSLA